VRRDGGGLLLTDGFPFYNGATTDGVVIEERDSSGNLMHNRSATAGENVWYR
jgi:hypothetical protein